MTATMQDRTAEFTDAARTMLNILAEAESRDRDALVKAAVDTHRGAAESARRAAERVIKHQASANTFTKAVAAAEQGGIDEVRQFLLTELITELPNPSAAEREGVRSAAHFILDYI